MISSWKSVIVSGFLFLIVLVLTLTLIPREGSAATLVVAQDDNGDYTTIQDAIDAAEDGDTIQVYEGTYYELVVVNKTVDLVGNGSGVTIIDGGGSGDVVKITADEVNVSGFMVTGSSWHDSGIIIESSHNRVMNNDCSNNYHGIYLDGSEYNTITNNTCSYNGGKGIYLEDSNHNTLTNNTCSYNRGHYGIHLHYSEDNTFTNNDCSGNNFGIYLLNSNYNRFKNNNFSNNYFSGIYLLGGENTTLTNNNCSYNRWYGIKLHNSDNATLTSNNCSYNKEYGIWLAGADNSTLTNNTCSNNSLGMYITYSNDNTLSNNTCSGNDDTGIYLYLFNSSSIVNNTLSNNKYGIYLNESYNNTIANNVYFENEVGIYEHWSKPKISRPVDDISRPANDDSSLIAAFIIAGSGVFAASAYIGGWYRERRFERKSSADSEIQKNKRETERTAAYGATLQDHNRWRPGN